MSNVVFGPATGQRLLEIAEANPRRPSLSSIPEIAFPGESITFLNESGEVIPSFACMRITGAIADVDAFIVTVAKPNNVGSPFIFNGPYEVEVDGLGQASDGILRARFFDFVDPEYGQYWGPTSGWDIEQQGHPALQVYSDIGNGLVIGRSLRGMPVEVKVVPNQDVSPGNAVECTIYEGQPPSPTNQLIPEVWLDWESGQEQISAGKEATAKYEPRDGVWRFVSAECETDSEPAVKVTASNDSSTPSTTESTSKVHVNDDGVFLRSADGTTFDSVTAPAP